MLLVIPHIFNIKYIGFGIYNSNVITSITFNNCNQGTINLVFTPKVELINILQYVK